MQNNRCPDQQWELQGSGQGYCWFRGGRREEEIMSQSSLCPCWERLLDCCTRCHSNCLRSLELRRASSSFRMGTDWRTGTGENRRKNINTMVGQEMFKMLSANMKDIKNVNHFYSAVPSSFKSLNVATSPFERSISKPRN